jgi:hypothetical protein
MDKKIIEDCINFLTRRKILQLVENHKLRKRWNNIMEIILFERIMNRILKKTEPYDAFHPIEEKEKEYIKKQLLIETKSQLDVDRNKLSNNFINIINNKYKIFHKYKNGDMSIKITNTDIKYKNIKVILDNRLRLLLKLSDEKIVLRCIFRYLSLGISGNHCALPTNVYNFMYDNFNVKAEGYSSPFNSKLMAKEGTIFCTLFEDTDKYFGSVGPFNHKKIIANQNVNWTVNPPYVASVLNIMYDEVMKAFEQIKRKDFLLIILIPKWGIESKTGEKNYVYHNLDINKSGLVIKKLEPDIGNHYMNCNGRTVKMNNTINSMFFLSRDKNIISDKHIVELSKLWNTYYEDKDNQSELDDVEFISN